LMTLRVNEAHQIKIKVCLTWEMWL
jgi:hypothetical protein